jgi:hypothetical protein
MVGADQQWRPTWSRTAVRGGEPSSRDELLCPEQGAAPPDRHDELLRPATDCAATSCSARPLLAPQRAAPVAASTATSCSALAEAPRHARQVPLRFGALTGRSVTARMEETKKLSRNAGARPIIRAREEGASVGRTSTGVLSADATHRPPHEWSCCRRERKMNWMRTMMPAAGWICGPCAT